MPWRDVLKIHPAADLFPPMTESELRELAEDIKTSGLHAPLVGWGSSEGQFLLDGRNRLDALALLGLLYETEDHHVGLKKWDGNRWTDRPGGRIGYAPGCEFYNLYDGDPYAIALSLNVHRRHLNAEQKRDLIAKVLAAKPELSDRAIGRLTNADHKTVGGIRSKANGEIPHKPAARAETGGDEAPNKPGRVEASGRKARGRKPAKPSEAPLRKQRRTTAEIESDKFEHFISNLGVYTDLIEDFGVGLSTIPKHLTPKQARAAIAQLAALQKASAGLIERIWAAGNGEAPVASSADPDLAIPPFLQRGAS